MKVQLNISPSQQKLSQLNKAIINKGLPSIGKKADRDYSSNFTSFNAAYAAARKKNGQGSTFIWKGKPILVKDALSNGRSGGASKSNNKAPGTSTASAGASPTNNPVRINNRSAFPIVVSNPSMVGNNGKIPNAGWGDTLSSTASGALTGFAAGAPAGGVGALPAALIGGGIGLISGLIKNKQEKNAEKSYNESINQTNATQLAQQRRLDNMYMQNYLPVNMPTLYPDGGELPSKKPFANVITILPETRDTIPQYLAAVPGPDGKAITPPPIPIGVNGRMDFTKVSKYARLYGHDALIKKHNKANGGEVGTVAIPNNNALFLNNNAELAVNSNGGTQGSHETGQNIPVINNAGQRTANVEPGEVVMTLPDGTKHALSKRLGFAQTYLTLDGQIKDLNIKMLNEKDSEKRSTLSREIDGLKRRINMLPAKQEDFKKRFGFDSGENKGFGDALTRLLTPRAGSAIGAPAPTSLGENGFLTNIFSNASSFLNKNSDTVSTIGQYTLPMVGNLLNTRDLNKSSKLINNLQLTPINVRPYDTKVDTSAQVNEVNRGAAEANLATRSLSNSQNAAQMKASIAANRVSGVNSIVESANNVSRDLKNKNVDLINNASQLNATRLDTLNQYKLENQVGLNNAKILGRNTAIDNMYQMLNEGNLKESDKTMLELIMKTYDSGGVFSRQLADLAKKYGLVIPNDRVQG